MPTTITRTNQRRYAIPYTPDTWTPYQAQCHMAPNLDEAFTAASCLSGGWYRRAVVIYCKVENLDEFYRILPHDAPAPDGYRPCYRVESVSE